MGFNEMVVVSGIICAFTPLAVGVVYWASKQEGRITGLENKHLELKEDIAQLNQKADKLVDYIITKNGKVNA